MIARYNTISLAWGGRALYSSWSLGRMPCKFKFRHPDLPTPDCKKHLAS